MAAEQKIYYDVLSSVENGINSGVSALLLQKNTLSLGINTSCRGTYVHPRPPMFRKPPAFSTPALQQLVEKNFFQGAGYYNPDFGPSSLVAQIGGRLFKFTDNGASFDVEDITIPGDPNDPTTGQVWMFQAEKWLIITDGTTKLPIFYDGAASRRSYGPSLLVASGTSAQPPTVPAVGAQVVLELAAPYTGPLNVPVLLNGHYYQVISAVVQAAVDPPPLPSGSNVSQIVVKNVTGVAGTFLLAGSDLIVPGASVSQVETIANVSPIPQSANNTPVPNATQTVLTIYSQLRIFQWTVGVQTVGLPFLTPYVTSENYTDSEMVTFLNIWTAQGKSVASEFSITGNGSGQKSFIFTRTVAATIPYSIPVGTTFDVTLSSPPLVNNLAIGTNVVINTSQTYGSGSVSVKPLNCAVEAVSANGQTITLKTTSALDGVQSWSYPGGEVIDGSPYALAPISNPSPTLALTVAYQGNNYSVPRWPSLPAPHNTVFHGVGATAGYIEAVLINGPSGNAALPNGSLAPAPALPSNTQYTTAAFSQTNVSQITIPLGQKITFPSFSNPNVTAATTVDAAVIPAVNQTVVVNVTKPYTGPANQQVQLGVNGPKFVIVGPFVPAPYVPVPGVPQKQFLTLSNLTDVPGVAYTDNLNVLSVPELPAGRMGAYGQSHATLCLTDGISFIYGDTLGGPSGTPAENYRDSVLKTTENTFLEAQGAFRIPNSGEIISSMTFVPLLDASLGQGPLQLGTPTSMFSCLVPSDRTTWATMTSPILPMSLKGKGPLAQNSTTVANSDTLFRTYDGLASLRMARADFQTSWSNTSISREVERILIEDDQSLLSYGSSVNFDNRWLTTAAPQASNQGVFHVGTVPLNFDPVSNLRGKLPSIYDADAWTGINVLQWVSGLFNGIERCFAFVWSFDEQKIELWELLKESTLEYKDNGTTPISWIIESAAIFNPKDRSPDVPMLKLQDGRMHLADIAGDVHVRVLFRPDAMECWTTWHEFDLCANVNATNGQRGYRTPIGLPMAPATDCERTNNRPANIGRYWQIRLEIIGHCTFMGAEFAASPESSVKFPKPVCATGECQEIQCLLPDDLRQYSLSGLPPLALPPVISAKVFNQTVYFNPGCEEGTVLTYSGTLPSWISIDLDNNQLVGVANTFVSGTLIGANAAAQDALNAWATAALTATTLVCASTAPSCDGLDTNQYKISPYADGDVANPNGPAPVGGETIFDGTLDHNGNDLAPCIWMARYDGGPEMLMNGLGLCNVSLFFSGGEWKLEFRTNNSVSMATWRGIKTTGTTPDGIYAIDADNSIDAGPATLTVISIGGVTDSQYPPFCSPS